MKTPHLTFFCELDAAALVALFAGETVIDHLLGLQAGVGLGILDLSEERAAVVKRLNEAQIPVIAWLLLPRDEGYWFNMNNAAQAAARYRAFKAWTAEHRLRWDGLGIDIEPDMREIQQIIEDRSKLIPMLAGRALDSERLRRAQVEYGALVAQMRSDGYRVESYHIPIIIDERRAGSTLLQRLTGLVDVPVDRDILMLYSSFGRAMGGPALLWSYGVASDIIAVGSTGGGVEVAGVNQVQPLTWDEFSRDLRLARALGKDVHVFSLEGCVRQNFLIPLRDFDWEQPAAAPPETVQRVEFVRLGIRALLWVSAHPFLMLLLFLTRRRR